MSANALTDVYLDSVSAIKQECKCAFKNNVVNNAL